MLRAEFSSEETQSKQQAPYCGSTVKNSLQSTSRQEPVQGQSDFLNEEISRIQASEKPANQKGGANLKKLSKLFAEEIEHNPFERDHSPVFNPERSVITPDLDQLEADENETAKKEIKICYPNEPVKIG